MPQPRLTVTGTNIDAPDANALADFYRRLLGCSAGRRGPRARSPMLVDGPLYQ